MEPVLFYYYWNNRTTDAWSDLENPTVLSIATVRHFHPDIPIYVIDVSDSVKNWDIFPETLKFTVLRRTALLRRFCSALPYNIPGTVIFPDLLSKTMDIYEAASKIPNTPIIVSDSDIFWIKPMLPLEGDLTKFCANRNSGFYYYDRHVPSNHEAIMLWTSLCSHVVVSELFADRVIRTMNTKYLQEETVLRYVMRYFGHYFSDLPWHENCSLTYFNTTSKEDVSLAKNVHCHAMSFAMGRENKGSLCLYVQEIRDILLKSLGEETLKRFFPSLEVYTCTVYDRERMNQFAIL